MKITLAHGDVILRPITKEEYEKLISEAERVKHNGSFILALGETTGHRHIITAERADTMTVHKLKDGRGVIMLTAPAKITHEEHEALETTETYYIQEYEREYDWFQKSVRKVQD